MTVSHPSPARHFKRLGAWRSSPNVQVANQWHHHHRHIMPFTTLTPQPHNRIAGSYKSLQSTALGKRKRQLLSDVFDDRNIVERYTEDTGKKMVKKFKPNGVKKDIEDHYQSQSSDNLCTRGTALSHPPLHDVLIDFGCQVFSERLHKQKSPKTPSRHLLKRNTDLNFPQTSFKLTGTTCKTGRPERK